MIKPVIVKFVCLFWNLPCVLTKETSNDRARSCTLMSNFNKEVSSLFSRTTAFPLE